MYSVLDNELARMHALLQTYMGLPKDRGHDYGLTHAQSYSIPPNSGIPQIYKRILEIQEVVIAAAIKADPELQEKIAELALTGVAK